MSDLTAAQARPRRADAMSGVKTFVAGAAPAPKLLREAAEKAGIGALPSEVVDAKRKLPVAKQKSEPKKAPAEKKEAAQPKAMKRPTPAAVKDKEAEEEEAPKKKVGRPAGTQRDTEVARLLNTIGDRSAAGLKSYLLEQLKANDKDVIKLFSRLYPAEDAEVEDAAEEEAPPKPKKEPGRPPKRPRDEEAATPAPKKAKPKSPPAAQDDGQTAAQARPRRDNAMSGVEQFVAGHK